MKWHALDTLVAVRLPALQIRDPLDLTVDELKREIERAVDVLPVHQRIENTTAAFGGSTCAQRLLTADKVRLGSCGMTYGATALLHLIWVEVPNKLATLPTAGTYMVCVSAAPCDTVAKIKAHCAEKLSEQADCIFLKHRGSILWTSKTLEASGVPPGATLQLTLVGAEIVTKITTMSGGLSTMAISEWKRPWVSECCALVGYDVELTHAVDLPEMYSQEQIQMHFVRNCEVALPFSRDDVGRAITVLNGAVSVDGADARRIVWGGDAPTPPDVPQGTIESVALETRQVTVTSAGEPRVSVSFHYPEVGYTNEPTTRQQRVPPSDVTPANPYPMERVDFKQLKPGRTYHVKVRPVCEWSTDAEEAGKPIPTDWSPPMSICLELPPPPAHVAMGVQLPRIRARLLSAPTNIADKGNDVDRSSSKMLTLFDGPRLTASEQRFDSVASPKRKGAARTPPKRSADYKPAAPPEMTERQRKADEKHKERAQGRSS